METVLIPSAEPLALERALQVLAAGGLVAFPTDTVYGVGALVFMEAAVESLYAAKGRSLEKAIPVLIGDLKDMGKVAVEVPPLAERLAARFWPGPLTLVVPKHPDLPPAVSSSGTVGVREPDHPLARTLLVRAGPLAVTSANRSGASSPTTAEQVLSELGGRIALILDGGTTPGGVPSTVVDCMGPEPRILREGALSQDQILTIMSKKL
jgi:L-threonylcarbamoyladenylate synthase